MLQSATSGCATTGSAPKSRSAWRSAGSIRCHVFDFGTGGLNLAYEVMRGYDALILVDVSRQGGEPGTLYVMEVEQDSIGGAIEDGEVIDPHGMDPQTVLRFVKAVGGWPGKVVVVACEPEQVEEMGFALDCLGQLMRRSSAPSRCRLSDRRRVASGGLVHELSLASAIVDAVVRHAEGRRVTVVSLRVGVLRQVVPESLEFCFGIVARESVCEGARLDYEVVPRDASLRASGTRRPRSRKLERPPLHVPDLQLGRCRSRRRRGIPDRVDRTGGR